MIIVYTRAQCAPCHTLLYFLKRRGIEYQEAEPDDSVWIFPTVLVGKDRIEGLNLPRLAELLAAQSD